jgi:hypothetical protein
MRLRTFVRLAGIALVVEAIREELSKDPLDREWHGRIGGVVPYDFRVPTVDRIRDAYWNPDDEHLFTDTVFGVGWAVNLAHVNEMVRERAAA